MSDVWFFGTLVTVGGNEEVEILTIAKEKRSGDRLSRISWLVERTSSVVLDSSLCVESRMKVTDDRRPVPTKEKIIDSSRIEKG